MTNSYLRTEIKNSEALEAQGIFKRAFVFSFGTILTFMGLFHFWTKQNWDVKDLDCLSLPEKHELFGLNLNEYIIDVDTVGHNEFLADILLKQGITYPEIAELTQNMKDIFDVRTLREGKQYSILKFENGGKASHFIYRESALKHYIMDFDNLSVRVHEEAPEIRETYTSGVIESSLWKTMMDNGMDYSMAAKLEDIMGWSISFNRDIQKGDYFKVYYDEEYLRGERLGMGKIHALYFNASGKEYYAVNFKNEKYDGYYNLEGIPMKKAFLKDPVRYSRISSRYNQRRFHPIQKRVKAHLGTDYAADYGTPIYAVADGVISKASYTKGNGNYVKIRHDKVYETQYLHMSKFARGITPGVRVKQGEVIGYVGSTGLATGPHVCFRFWKNGQQVDHLRLNLPEPDPLPEKDLPGFFRVRDELKSKLDSYNSVNAELL